MLSNSLANWAWNVFFTDYREAIDLPQVNVVSICIPTNLHAEVTLYSAERGKHVLTEKPIALDLQQADAMIAAARENGSPVQCWPDAQPLTGSGGTQKMVRQWTPEPAGDLLGERYP